MFHLYPPLDLDYSQSERETIFKLWFDVMDQKPQTADQYVQWATNYDENQDEPEFIRPDELKLMHIFLEEECKPHRVKNDKMVLKT